MRLWITKWTFKGTVSFIKMSKWKKKITICETFGLLWEQLCLWGSCTRWIAKTNSELFPVSRYVIVGFFSTWLKNNNWCPQWRLDYILNIFTDAEHFCWSSNMETIKTWHLINIVINWASLVLDRKWKQYYESTRFDHKWKILWMTVLYHHILSTPAYSYQWLLCIKLKYSWIFWIQILYKSNCRFCHNCNSCNSFYIVYSQCSIDVNNRKFVNVHRGCTYEQIL